MLNGIIVTILVLLSKFQRFLNSTEEKAASIQKMFMVQFINTGLVILLVNAKISSIHLPAFFPIFSGRFDDFTVEWYKNVGATISLTMFINIFTPHISGFVAIAKGFVTQFLDRGLSSDIRRTKQVMQEDYEAIYMGPEFLIEVRYSQILTFFFISMIYSSGIPVLNVISLFQFFLMYWVDKFLFLRMYRTPPPYGIELSDKSRNLM